MPNWCFTEMVFFTPNEFAEEIVKLHDCLDSLENNASDAENGFETTWLGTVLEYHGLDNNNVSCRGSYSNLGEIEENAKYEETYFSIQTEDAWFVQTDMWDMLLKQKYPHVEYVYRAEECGMCLFYNTDSRSCYLPERYLIDYAPSKGIDYYEYFTTEEELLLAAEYIFKRPFKTMDELYEFAETIPEDDYLGIREFIDIEDEISIA